jgi:uncharacterized protein (DUF433 family)
MLKSLDSYIESTPAVMGGKPRIAGRRIRVYDVVVWVEQQQQSIGEIVADYQLSPQEVYAALAYYHEHKDEIDAQMAADREYANELQGKFPSELAERRSKLQS